VSEYHEPEGELTAEVRDEHRALTSLKEEIEAVDWYNQRWAASKNESLRAVLAHNRDEEIEHACMTLEWLRRNVPRWDEMLRMYLFSEGPITEVEKEATGKNGGAAGAVAGGGDLGIGGARRTP
jgi:ferritin-like protein